jgi:membrane associated rhomboid family serine protease
VRAAQAPATVAIIAATAAGSLLVLLAGSVELAAVLGGFLPARVGSLVIPAGHGAVPVWLTPLTATLIHGGPAHLLLNLLTLGFCGVFVEQALGWRALVALYAVGAYAAAAGQWAIGPADGPMIGASGAISAVLAAYALLFGKRQAPAIGPVPGRVVQLVWLAVAWVAIQLLVGIAGLGGAMPIAVGAHVGGFLAGLLLTRPLLLWRYRRA